MAAVATLVVSTLIIGATSLSVYLPAPLAGQVIRTMLIVTSVGFVIVASVGLLFVRAQMRGSLRWLTESRQAHPDELRRLARVPATLSQFVMGAWCVSVPVMLLVADRLHERIEWNLVFLQNMFVVMAFGAAAAAMFTYVVVEPVVRPPLASALPSDPEAWPRTLGVRMRLLLTTAIFLAGPLVVIGLIVLRLDVDQRAQAGRGVVAASALSAILGFIVSALAGSAITGPLGALRARMRRVTEGDLQARVDAVEGGEIGLLQAGFNHMLEGLQERERLRDVFGRHVGMDVARRAMETGAASEGELTEATVLFVDMVGSTSLAERSSPRDVVATLNGFFDCIVRVVSAEGGLVSKFMGDGALCVFGAPTPVDDHAARALRAGRLLYSELATLSEVRAAIGIGSGEMVAGDVGAVDRYEYTVIGDAVNEASRLCEAAKSNRMSLLASERAIRAAGDEADYWLRGETMQLRGKSEPTVTYSPAPI